MENKVIIYEMFLRDGLQSIKKNFPYETRFDFYKGIVDSGITNIEIGSTTSEKILPQMSNILELSKLVSNYNTNDSVVNNYILCTGTKGLEKILLLDSTELKHISLVCSLSDKFGILNLKKNSKDSVKATLEQLDIIGEKLQENIGSVRIYLSCFYGSLWEEFNDEYIKNVIEIINTIETKINTLNINNKVELVLSDTYGFAGELYLNKTRLEYMFENIKITSNISIHLHTNDDFYNLIDICLNNSVTRFDSSILGIGGCPFAEDNLKGNIDTYKLVKYLSGKNIQTKINLEKLKKTGEILSKFIFCQDL